jgi:hypothetical protein
MKVVARFGLAGPRVPGEGSSQEDVDCCSREGCGGESGGERGSGAAWEVEHAVR